MSYSTNYLVVQSCSSTMFKWYLFQLLTTGLKLVLPLTMSADHNLSDLSKETAASPRWSQKLRPRDLGSKTERSHRADGFAETARETAPPQWSPSWPAACFQTCLSPFLALGELDGGVGTSWMWKMRWGGDELTARPNTCCVDSCVQSYLSPILFWLGNTAFSWVIWVLGRSKARSFTFWCKHRLWGFSGDSWSEKIESCARHLTFRDQFNIWRLIFGDQSL